MTVNFLCEEVWIVYVEKNAEDSFINPVGKVLRKQEFMWIKRPEIRQVNK